jgi:hypothetical protein
MSEYYNSSVNGLSCSYATLAHYNNGSAGMRPPVPATTVSGKYIVPTWSAPGYNTLMHNDVPSCSGYFNIQAAYGKDAGSCSTKYVTKLCQ